jgi:hypothetical protein
MKVKSTIYKGIEYIQVRELPADQQELLLQSINHELLIKIMVEGQLVGNCLQFKDYETWFDNVFKIRQNSPSKSSAVPESQEKVIVPVESVKGSR